jgi:hypothetical protein
MQWQKMAETAEQGQKHSLGARKLKTKRKKEDA